MPSKATFLSFELPVKGSSMDVSTGPGATALTVSRKPKFTVCWTRSRLNISEREEFLDIFLSVCQWTHIYYAWRPNLRDDGDNHVIELAVAGQAQYGELRFPQLRVVIPGEILKETS